MFFHPNCGENIKLINARLTAEKAPQVSQNTLVFSGYPLNDDFRFYIRIIKKNEGHRKHIMKLGVTTLDPNVATIVPKSIETLHKFADTWFLFGDWVANNQSLNGVRYGGNINSMKEGDTVGIVRTSKGELEYSVNGRNFGVAAKDLPRNVFGVVDMCGLAYQISIYSKFQEPFSPTYGPCASRIAPFSPDQVFSRFQVLSEMNFECNLPSTLDTTHGAIPKGKPGKLEDKLRFHKRTGSLVKLSASRRSAQRRHPLDEFNNGVVMTHRYLYDDEFFEIRIDCLVNKWSGSIEVGVTTHNPSAMEFPATMTNMRSGTIMMSGCGILTNGRGTRREYGNFNLDQLQAGDKVGLIRKANGNLHYFINGLDQGIAASRINQQVWGVVDLYGMTVKVSIMDPDGEDLEEHEDIMNVLEIGESSRVPTLPAPPLNREPEHIPFCVNDILAFHPNCGSHAVVINNGQTAHRPYATDDFNNGVVLTNRPLRPDELFEVRLEKIISKWAGSIEIGVTLHSPNDLEFPFTMTNMKSGTWMMTGIGIMHNRVTVREQYATSSLDQLIVGDRVGVMRQSCGTLRFFVNGIDQGPATSGIPENIYGVIDLYGQAAQATIVQVPSPPESLQSSYSNATLHGGELAFHRICGDNVTIGRNGDVAYRYKKKITQDALLLSNRPLREFEMFQVRIDNREHNCRGLMSIGVTTQFPTKVVLPPSPSDLCKEIYMLDGNVLYNNNTNARRPYTFDMDTVPAGTLLGVMRHADRSVHYYVDGVDQGKAWDIHSINMYAVIDLYGQCTQVTITPPKPRAFANSENSLMLYTGSSQIKQHTFSEYCGSNVKVHQDGVRVSTTNDKHKGNLLFSSSLLKPDEIFEVEIMSCNYFLPGSIKIGVTDFNILNAHINTNLPNSMEGLPKNTFYIDGQYRMNNLTSNVSFTSFNLRNLRNKDTVALRRIGYTEAIGLMVNSVDRGVVFENVPDKVYVVFEMVGPPKGLRVTSLEGQLDMSAGPDDHLHSIHMIDSFGYHCEDCVYAPVERLMEGTQPRRKPSLPFEGFHSSEFYCHHGNNIIMDNDARTAHRHKGYNQGLVVVNHQIMRGQSFQFVVQKMNNRWSSGLMVGAGRFWLPRGPPPSSADLGIGYWMVSADTLYLDGYTKRVDYGHALERVRVGSIVAIIFTESGELQLVIDGVNYGAFVKINPKFRELHPVIDVYGKCEQVGILNTPEEADTVEVSMVDDLSNSVTVTVKGNQIDEVNHDDVTTGYDATQQCEKADLEYHEKETFHGYEDFVKVPEGSSISKSISYDDSLDILLQNPCVANELKNIEIKNKSVLSIQRKECSNVWTKCFDTIEVQPPLIITDPRSPFQHSFPFSSEDDDKNNSSILSKSMSSQQLSVVSTQAIAPPEAFASTSNGPEVPTVPEFLKLPVSQNIGRLGQIMEAMITYWDKPGFEGYNENTLRTYEEGVRLAQASVNYEFDMPSTSFKEEYQPSEEDGHSSDGVAEGDPLFEGFKCNNMGCTYMRRLILYKHDLKLPDIFSNVFPRCFCLNCFNPAPTSRIPHDWVRFPIRGYESIDPKWDRGFWHVPPGKINEALATMDCEETPFRLERLLHQTYGNKNIKQRYPTAFGNVYYMGAALELALCIGEGKQCCGCQGHDSNTWSRVNSYRFAALYLHYVIVNEGEDSDKE